MAIPLTRRLPQTAEAAQAVAPRTPAQLAWRQLRKHRLALVGGAILILLYSMSLFADFISPYTLDSSDRAKFYHPPTIPRFIDGSGRLHWRPFVYDTQLVDPGLRIFKEDRSKIYPVRFFVRGEPYRLFWVVPTRIHLLGVDEPARLFLMGTDGFGRDLMTRILYGSRVSLIILIFIGWAGFSRLIRGFVLSLKEREYILAARAMGLDDFRIIVRHILPNTSSLVIIVASLTIPGAILGESGLSFLGLGVREPCSSWGNLLSAGANLVNLSRSPWLLFPGLFIVIAVVAYNFLGDGLRDAFDPRLRTN